MKDSVGNGGLNLGLGPRGMPLSKPRRQHRAHAAIHPLGLAQALLRSHCAHNRQLALVRAAVMS
jgi:hypothetical protein